MASRKEQKEEARQARIAAEQAAAAKAAQTRRLSIIAGVLVVAVVIAGVAIAVSSGSKSKTGSTPGLLHGKSATKTYDSINALIGNIPQSGETIGYSKAKVTLGYFGDLECPICMEFTTGVNVDGTTGGLPQFIADQVATGKAKLSYKSFCTATCSDYSDGQSIFNTQQVAAYAAGLQNKFWDYEELFYHEQQQEGSGYVTESYLDGLARQIPGLNYAEWLKDRKDPNLISQVQADESLASKDQVSGTPTIYVSGPKGTELVGDGVLPYSQLVSAINSVE